jgi:two-component system, sensor histidine kinase and response regulator
MTEKGSPKSTWDILTGHPDEFSMENRAFNYICIVTFLLLVFALISDMYLCRSFMSGIISTLLCILALMYYFSRVKKSFKASVVVYVLCSYFALTFNFFANEGINGTTIPLFCITLVFILVLVKPVYHPVWLAVHLFVILAILGIEYYYPQTVTASYPDRTSRFQDIGATSIVCIAFIYLVVNYLRNYYDTKRILADERALSIQVQNEQIIAQNIQLEKVNDEKNKLFSIVSHDLKSPLDSIRGYLELLTEHQLDQKDKDLIEEELLVQTRYTTDLLLNLTSWAKTQMDGVTVNLIPINLNSFVNQIADHKVAIASRKGLKLSYTIDPDINVIADEDMMHIVVRNLINNAIKFTPESGEVIITAEQKENFATLSVQDTGIGIPPEKQAEIFTLKTSSTYGTNREKGIGLGLMMCKEFMDYQQGSIWFDSIPAKGSTFYISLPLAKK